MSQTARVHYSRHFNVMKDAKNEIDSLIEKEDFFALQNILKAYDSPYSYCKSGNKNVLLLDIFGHQFTMGLGGKSDLAQYPLRFWARRYVEGSYPQTEAAFNAIAENYSSFCKSNTCLKADPLLVRAN